MYVRPHTHHGQRWVGVPGCNTTVYLHVTGCVSVCLYGLECISTCPIVSGRVQMRMCADVCGFGFVFETQSDVA